MNKIKIIFFLLFLTAKLNAGFIQLSPKVDERFELTSIAFRLAEAEEYANNQLRDYTSDVDKYFSQYKNHDLILYIKTIRQQQAIGYDAVSISATLLEIMNGKVSLSPYAEVDKYITVDPRWTKESLTHYVVLLNKFYEDTKFQSFYNQHRELYRQAEQQLNILLKSINSNWFESFYGEPFGNPYVYIALCNGGSNYAFSSYLKNKPSEYGIVIGCIAANESNIPIFDKHQILPVIVHEYAHRFTNPLIGKYEADIKNAGETILPYVKDQLNEVGYVDSHSMLIEGFNNLFTCMYYKENPTGFEKYHIAENQRRGFIWMKRAVSFMNNFYADRRLYPTISDFFPQLIDFMNYTSNNIDLIINEYKSEPPYVVNTYPVLNSIVNANIDTIRIEFSCPMANIWKVKPIKNKDRQSPRYSLLQCRFSSDMKTLLIPVSLENNTSYGICISNCQSEDRFVMEEEFELIFKTK